ncbi:MAG: hypothetical protein PHQ91_05335 [Thermoanaerobaculaceae bacterium]|nr:hypothetical protein [Thermoanaerobaculaceae bacterium]TAM55751.1 MAG: hypothetical protein EPN53_02685 [Acidobacteriota bacterium]
MSSNLATRPLLRWDGFTLRIDLDMVELVVNRELARRVPALRRLEIAGEGDELELRIEAAWQGIPARISARVRELRLHRRVFGCRLEGLRGPLGIPLPVSLAGAVARRLGRGMVRFDPEDHVVLADLRQFLPEGLEVRVKDVRCEGRWLRVELAGGSLAAVLAGVAGAAT